jgi:Septum formation
VWPWVLGGVAVLLLVIAGVIVLTQGDDDGSTVTAERDTTTTESPSTTTTSESPSTTETGAVVFVDDLRLGDCFNESNFGKPGGFVGEITVVDCGSAHDGETFAVATLPGDPEAPYPGDDELDTQSSEICLREFAPYVGIDFLDSKWEVNWFRPSEVSWRKYDDRVVICYLGDPDFNKIEGSKRNSRT